MQTVHLTERIGKDGVLNVRVPLGLPEADYDVVLVVQPKATGSEDRGWPAGYFDLAGSIDDETFIRQPQGELTKPVDLE